VGKYEIVKKIGVLFQMSGADPQGATQSRLLSTWKPLRQAQCGACGLMAESALADFHELRQGF